MALQTATIGHLRSLFGQGPDPIFLLGAGTSLSSGIPLADKMVEKMARWEYCRENSRSHEDPRILRSDWHPWLINQNWYREDWELSDNYPSAVENILQPREARKEFFLDILNTQVPPSSGYECMAELMARNYIRTVLTTNFDAILLDLCQANPRPHHVDVIQTTSDYTKLSTSPQYPQIIYLHGSIENYNDKNSLAETAHLDADLVSRLVPLLRDHPLIVIGYRGAELSIMRHLLINHAEAADNYRNGIYWCARNYEEEGPDGLAPFVHELAGQIQKNFQIVPIDGFDELIEVLKDYILNQQLDSVHIHTTTDFEESTVRSYDLQLIKASSIDDFEWPPMRVRLLQYCERMGIQVPPTRNDDWIIQLLCDQELASHTKERNTFPTVGGYLLFAETPQSHIQTAKVIVHLKGNPEWLESVFNVSDDNPEQVIEGNLWNQLEEIYGGLSRVNRSFLLKEGRHSKSVYPYPPDALREMVVNALVHRDYEKDEPIEIEIGQTCIRIRNPGGLVQDVIEQMTRIPDEETESNFETKIKGGARGIRGYRNPVVADLFYGTEEMEKAGSGLSDIWQKSEENKNEVSFGPVDNNTAFEITISCRPEVVDEITRTASSTSHFTRYVSNLLEVINLPDVVWHAGTNARRAKEVWEETGANWLPPFTPYKGRLFTFHNLSTPANPLYAVIDANDIEKVTLEEFINAYGERCFVWLLNECFYRHLEAQGLWIDKKRERAYFPQTDKRFRTITYKARVRRATRKVVIKKNRYWEHKSFWFRFERFGDAWALVLLPSYVFTTDGKATPLEGDLVNKFSTTRQSRDYNNVVHNDLVFWTWVLAEGKHGTFTLNTNPTATQVGMTSSNEIHKFSEHQIRINGNLLATVAPDFGDDAWGIESLEQLDANQLAKAESEFSQAVPKLVEEEDVDSDGTDPITNTQY